MSQFFCNKCFIICSYQGDNINHFCRRIKNRFKKIEFIKDLSNNNFISSQTKYFFIKLFWKKNIFFTDNKSKYFCQINNKNGIAKTIIDESTLLDIVKREKDINIQNKLDGLFGLNIVTKLNIININENTNKTNKIDIFHYLLNIDRNIEITLKEILNIYDIDYKNYVHIVIEYTCGETFKDFLIFADLADYLNKNVHDLL
jgi:hypothetical protein